MATQVNNTQHLHPNMDYYTNIANQTYETLSNEEFPTKTLSDLNSLSEKIFTTYEEIVTAQRLIPYQGVCDQCEEGGPMYRDLQFLQDVFQKSMARIKERVQQIVTDDGRQGGENFPHLTKLLSY